MEVVQLSLLLTKTWQDICSDDLATMNGRKIAELHVLHKNTSHWNKRDLRSA